MTSAAEALHQLAVSNGWASQDATLPTDLDLERTAAHLGLDLERRQIGYRDIPTFIKHNRAVLFETSDGWIPGRRDLRDSLFTLAERDLAVELEPALTGLSPEAKQRAIAALTSDHLAKRSVTAYRVGPAVTSRWLKLARQSGWISILMRFVVCEGIRIGLWIWTWKQLFTTVADRSWILTLLAVIPFHLLALWWQSKLAIEFSRTLKQRMLATVLRLDPEALSAEGTSAILGTVNESATLESLALSGGFQAIVGAMELGAAAVVMVRSAAALPLLTAFGTWVLVAGWIAWRFYAASRRWTRDRLQMTDSLVERMIGHRTRLAQEHPEHWHDVEDQELGRYETISRRRDHAEAWLTSVAADGWLLLGLAFIPIFDLPALGGVLLAHAALKALTTGAWQLALAAAGFERVQGLLAKPEANDPQGSSAVVGEGALAIAHVEYKHASAALPLLADCNLTLQPGDRAVLEGESGGGKSTLVALLAGIREPSSGVILASGVDRASMGANAWRRVVALAPQFHQNHVFTGPLAFNLLVGAPEPWTEDRVRESYAIANELGLRKLIGRMPAGMLQVLGETGWQLSQGERSRIFMARTLLQEAPVVILDESLAALDPETFEQVLKCLEKRATTLLVIAHR